MRNILNDDYFYRRNDIDIDINKEIEENFLGDTVVAIDDIKSTHEILRQEKMNRLVLNRNDIGFISNFYNFRKRINSISISDINASIVELHKEFINIDSHITINDLLNNSINYFNSIMIDYIPIKQQRFIDLNDREIAFLCLQYNACDYIKRCDNKKEYGFEIFYIQNHPVTKFFTMLILYYFYNELFSRKIKDYKKQYDDISDVDIISILYKKLINFSIAFDNCRRLCSYYNKGA